MKRSTLHPLAVMVLAASLINWSCSKINWKDIDQKQQVSKCDVAEYHVSTYDEFELWFPFLFKKTYDQSGKVKEIECSFWTSIPSSEVLNNHLLVEQKGRRLYLINKYNPNDTVMKANLNNKGRVEYYETNGGLDLFNAMKYTFGSFVYKNNRLVFFRSGGTSDYDQSHLDEDSLYYDPQGNLLAFKNNYYEYDYTRTAKEQFYIDDLMKDQNNGYYVLQYLGYFPEVTNPPNLRSHGDAGIFVGNMDNHTFDAEGKLTGYQFAGRQATITWNCK